MKQLLLSALIALSIGTANAADQRILVFGDSNTFGWQTDEQGTVSRMPIDVTWPGQMAQQLGSGYEVIVEGLGGRTTDVDKPIGSGSGRISGVGMNGAAYLPAALSSHMPLDLVIIMLGTNDMHRDIHRSANDIALALGRLAQTVVDGNWQLKTHYPAPKVLIVSPPKLNLTTSPWAAFYEGAKEKSEALAAAAEPIVKSVGASFYNAALAVPYGEAPDQIHLTSENHRILGAAVAEQVRHILSPAIVPAAE